jgi:hypothetical protein
MAQRGMEGASDNLGFLISREYEDYLDWLENHHLPTEGADELRPVAEQFGGRLGGLFAIAFGVACGGVGRFF